MCDNMQGSLQTWEVYTASVFRVFIGTQLHKLGWLLTWLTLVFRNLTDTTWPKASIVYHIVRLSLVVQQPPCSQSCYYLADPGPPGKDFVQTWHPKGWEIGSWQLRAKSRLLFGQGYHLYSRVSEGAGLSGGGVSPGEDWECVLRSHAWIVEESGILLYKMWCFQGLVMSVKSPLNMTYPSPWPPCIPNLHNLSGEPAAG